MEKGIGSLVNGKGKAKDVLFIEGLKHNLLNVSQMCDQGYDALFRSNNYQIMSTGTSEVVAKVVRTNNNFYVMKENS